MLGSFLNLYFFAPFLQNVMNNNGWSTSALFTANVLYVVLSLYFLTSYYTLISFSFISMKVESWFWMTIPQFITSWYLSTHYKVGGLNPWYASHIILSLSRLIMSWWWHIIACYSILCDLNRHYFVRLYSFNVYCYRPKSQYDEGWWRFKIKPSHSKMRH